MGFIIEGDVLKKFEGDEEVAIVPDNVTSIGFCPFVNLPNLKRIEFPDSISRLPDHLIYNCDHLESVRLPRSIKSIAAGAFTDCKGLKSIEIPEGVTDIGYIAFKGCESLESVSLPSTIKRIDKEAFSYCPIRSVYIPSIDIWLKQVALWDNPLEHRANLYVNGELFEDLIIPEGIEHIGTRFEGCTSIKSVVFPESMKDIDSDAFMHCSNLQKVVFSSSISMIRSSSFGFCTNLKEVYFPNEESLRKLTGNYNNFFESYDLPPVNVYINGVLLDKAVIEEGTEKIKSKAFQNIASISSVYIPDSVKSIGSYAFSGCVKLNIEEIPQNITEIGDAAFYNCKSLTITETPQNVTSIGRMAFAACDNIKELKFSEKLETIGEAAFTKCSGLRELFIPSTIKSIGQRAFASCENLKEVNFESLIPTIEKEAFADNPSLIIRFPAGTLATKDKLPIGLCTVEFIASNEELAYIILYQKLKTWKDWVVNRSFDHPDDVFEQMMHIYQNDKKAPSDVMASFVLSHINCARKEQIEKLLKLMEERKYKELQDFASRPEIISILSGEKAELDPIEEFVQEYLKKKELEPEAVKVVKTGLPYAESGKLSSKEAVSIILTEYMHEMSEKMYVEEYSLNAGMLRDGTKINKRSDADRIGLAIDQKALSDYLEGFMEKQTYRSFLIAWARYATDESIARVTSTYKTMLKGKAKEQYKAQNVREALLINDSQGAMKFFDRIGDLERYAQMRGMSAMAMRDSVMLPEFGFDSDGIKRYDIGGNIIEVSITPDLEFRLFDVNAQKEIRSIPKKSDDPKKAESASKEYNEFKKETLSFAKARTELIHTMHLSGELIDPELWRKVYVNHPIIRHISQLLVWQDESGKTFTITDGNVYTSSNDTYTPTGKIRVAHVLNMEKADIDLWQQYLAKSGKKQLFDQIWEPVIPWSKAEISNRYQDSALFSEERNSLKKALKQRGIESSAEYTDREYNPRTGQYEYGNNGTMYYGNCLYVDFTVDPDTKEITFGKATSRVEPGDREINAVLLELDKATISSQVVRDNDAAINTQTLSVFTASQISSLLNLAIEKKAEKCTALLLNYKNEHFPEFADVNEFSLDW